MADDETEERIQLSAAQIAASSAAAVSAAVVCSLFGVAGTVIGTAVASVLATVGSALYSYSLRRTRARLRRLHQAGAAAPPLTEVVKTARQQGQRLWSQLPLRLLAIGVVAVFAVSIGVITVVELGIGKPLSTLVGGSNSGGTSLVPKHRAPKTSPSPKPTSTTSPTATSTPTPTATHTATKSPAPSSTPTVSTTPSSVLSSLLPHKSPSHKHSSP
jgi:hypothetical protein